MSFSASNSSLTKLIFDQALEAMVIVNDSGKILEANLAFKYAFKILQSEILNQKIQHLVKCSDQIFIEVLLSEFVHQNIFDTQMIDNACSDQGESYSYHIKFTKILEGGMAAGILINFMPTQITQQELSIEKRNNLQRQSDALIEIAKKSFWRTGNLEECYKIVSSLATEVLNIENCSIWMMEGDQLVCKTWYQKTPSIYTYGYVMEIKKYPNYFHALKATGIIDAVDCLTDKRTVEFLDDYFIPNNVYSLLDIAIKSNGEVCGIFCCEEVGKQKEWQLDEKNFASYLCETISHALSTHKENEIKKDILIREQYFQSLIENSLDIIAIINENAQFTYFSPSLKRILGYENDEVIGKTPFDFVHPEDHAELISAYLKVFSEYGYTLQTCFRYSHKNGDWRHIESVAKNLLDISGVNGVVINIRDITDRVIAENEILRKEKYFRLLTENSFDVRYTSDVDGMITYISPSVKEILGYSTAEIIGTNGWYYIDENYKELLSKEWEKMASTPNGFLYNQFLIVRKDGSKIEVELIAKNMLADPDINGVIVTFRDITERKIFEKKVLESEEYFRSLIENSNDAMTIIDSSGNRTYVSPSTEKIFGRSVDGMLGQSPFALVHPEDIEETMQLFFDLCKYPDKVINHELRMQNAENTDWINIEITAKNLLLNPVVKGVVLNGRDITEKKKVKQKLKDSEEYFRALIENTSDVISVIDKNGVRKFSSLSVKHVFGRNPEEILGKSPMDIVHPEDLPLIKMKLKELLENPGIPIKSEARMQHANGQWIHIDVVGCNLLHNPAVGGIVLNGRDITDTKLAQQNLALSEKYFRSLIENSNDMLAICDEHSHFFYASPSIERFLGFSNQEYLNSTLKQYIHADFEVSCKKVLKKSLEHPGITFKQELYHRHKNGHYVYLETIFNNLIYDEAVKGIVMISREISERKNAELILQNYNAQLATEVNNKTIELKTKNDILEDLLKNLKSAQAQMIQSEKMASLGLLTAGIAHEINNPINFITANVKPLRRDINSLKEFLDVFESFDFITDEKKIKQVKKIKSELEIDYSLEEMDQLLNGIEEGANRTYEIVKSLRNFSRLDEIDLQRDDINSSINNTLLLLQSNFQPHIKIVKNYNTLPLIECYPGKLNQVFMNIIFNAVQSIEGEGSVTISTVFEKENSQVKISVKDTGIGMSEETMKKIFEPFYTTKPVGDGTGLGLFISFGIIESHHGYIEVKSRLGLGSEFIISLPLQQSTKNH